MVLARLPTNIFEGTALPVQKATFARTHSVEIDLRDEDVVAHRAATRRVMRGALL